ncbi:hypothetical protein [Halorussus amylolyticus]|uniref:hypothetical protein n=1 Tax=Halorussus amylolyticus TaxID=1126242 RepID=UPI00104812A7|nr:hypothetical protein [Halorussus amylolyticus]
MPSLLDRLRNPAYTGEGRCWPCTVANAIFLLLACAGISRRRSRASAAALGLVGAAVITLRGYLVPYTPRFAPRLAARLPGDPFEVAHSKPTPPTATLAPATPPTTDGGESSRADDTDDDDTGYDATDDSTGDADATPTPEASGSLVDDEETGERVLTALLERGVVVADDETLSLDGEFREAWRAQVRDLRERDDSYLAATLEAAAPEGLVAEVVEPRDEVWVVVSDGSDDPANERWLARPVAVADAAAARALADRTDLAPDVRARVVGPLRTFLESCPACDGPVEETTTMNCCGGPSGARVDAPDDVLACADCGARLYTFE